MSKPNKVNLSKLRRCPQAWEEMPQLERGRLCTKCNNTILDFRNTSDAEIARAHLFSERKVCGLYREDQLLEPKRRDGVKQKKNRLASLYFGVLSVLSLEVDAQEQKVPITIEERVKDTHFNEKEAVQSRDSARSKEESLVISGRITDLEGNALPFANAIVKGKEKGASADVDGYYSIDLSEWISTNEKLYLRYVYFGYEPVEVEIERANSLDGSNRVLDVRMLGGAEIIEFAVYERAPFYRRAWNSIQKLFRKNENVSTDE